ncbi:MAG: MBOAT family protein [Lachnospiraceae bacterium]|nr:MBOAT family protein [Lachnospiraceae bacterium]
MIFNSYQFIFLFLPTVVIIYHFINSKNRYEAAKIFLLVASLAFYVFFSFQMLLILILSILLNYLISLGIYKNPHNTTIKKTLLFIGIAFNLGLLIYYKYLGFFDGIINSVFKTGLSVQKTLIPLGISYYTFSQIAFLTDTFKDSDKKYNFIDYALFISFFPKISVGPIMFAKDLIPQFNDPDRKKTDYNNIARGIIIFTMGLAKKVLVADHLSKYVTWGYSNIDKLGTTNALLTMLAYTLQIYFDFSGYCDMAKGIFQLLNLKASENFLSPYKALSIADFWKKWHITLTSFFTNYVYIPLGGNRKGKLRTYINMFIIFFLSGLWHGADFTFIIWGILHGIGITFSKLLKDKMLKIPKTIRHLGTFIFINITWVFFRSSDLNEALDFFRQLFSFKFIPINIEFAAKTTPDELQFIQWLILSALDKTPYLSACIISVGFLLCAIMICFYCKNSSEITAGIKLNSSVVTTTVILLVLSILSLSNVTEFIYTNF